MKPKEQINYANMLKVPYIKGIFDTLKRDLKKEEIDVIFSKAVTLEKYGQ